METNKQELAKEALKALSEIEDTLKVENLVKDNVISFDVDGAKYRIRKPTYSETEEGSEAKRKEYLRLIKDDSYLFRKQWIETYSKKGINIAEMENKVKSAKYEMETMMLRLATAQGPKEIEDLKKEVLKLKDEQFTISMQVTDLLNYCIETQIEIFSLSYSAYLALEKQIEEEWVKPFESFDEFRKSEDNATQLALMYISYLIYNIEK